MKKAGFQFLLITGLFLLIGQVFADEASQAAIEQTRSSSGSYSTTMNSNRKTTITSSDGKIIDEEIYSPNKKFYAVADINKRITTIYEVILQGNIGRRKNFWAMDGCFEMLGLSNDGKHLVVGYHGTNVIPTDYQKAQVMLSFFKCSELINKVGLDQLITDFSKLQRTDSGYYWVEYLGLNAAGYYVVETVEGEKILFDVMSGKPVKFKSEESCKLPNWKTYQDIMRCYEFQYPDNYLLEENYDLLLKRKNTGWIIRISIEEIVDYPRDLYDPAKMSFEEFAIHRAKLMCCADGCNSSQYATDVEEKKLFVNPNNLDVVEFYLTIINETYFEDSEESKIEKSIKGPIYAVSISQLDESYRVLLFELIDNREKNLQEKEMLKKMINTVKILK